MLELTVYDGDVEVVLEFEHSLLSLSKWEAEFRKPFLTNKPKTSSELIDYYGHMIVTPGVDKTMVYRLSPDQLDQLEKYMNTSQTASSVPEQPSMTRNQEQVTSELIYYWLVGLQIPFHPVETWHLSRLMMLVQITSYKQKPAKDRKEGGSLMDKYRAMNEARKKKYGTSG